MERDYEFKEGKYDGILYSFHRVSDSLNNFLQRVKEGQWYFQHPPISYKYGKILLGAIHESKIEFSLVA